MSKIFGRIRARNQLNIRRSRKETIYKFELKKHGMVACFVCGCHVKWRLATLEHIQPLSKGGTDDMENLAISHYYCNQKRGNKWREKEDV